MLVYGSIVLLETVLPAFFFLLHKYRITIDFGSYPIDSNPTIMVSALWVFFFFFLILVVIGFLLFKFVMLLCNKNIQLWVKLDSVIQLVFSYLNFEIQFDCMFWAMHHLFCLFYFFLPALYFCILVSSSFSIQRMFFVFNCGPCFFTQICICVPGLHTVSERLLRFSSPNL